LFTGTPQGLNVEDSEESFGPFFGGIARATGRLAKPLAMMATTSRRLSSGESSGTRMIFRRGTIGSWSVSLAARCPSLH
jgi:hypothetical protein